MLSREDLISITVTFSLIKCLTLHLIKIRIHKIQCLVCSNRKLYQELSLGSLQLHRWYRNLCLFYKIFKNLSAAYFFNLIPARKTHYSLRNSGNISCFNTKHNFFKHSFFSSTIIEFNKLDVSLTIALKSSKWKF